MQTLKTVGIILGVILIAFFAQKYFADQALKDQKAEYEATIDGLAEDTTKLSKQVTEQTGRANSKQQQLDRQAALYGQSAATVADQKRTISDLAARLSMAQQIDAIAGALGPQYTKEAERIKQSATDTDSKLVSELYQRVLWEQQQAGKLDTTLRENARLRTENERLVYRETIYKATLANVRDKLLSEADITRFLGIGRKDAMQKLATEVSSQISDLEKNLNGPQR